MSRGKTLFNLFLKVLFLLISLFIAYSLRERPPQIDLSPRERDPSERQESPGNSSPESKERGRAVNLAFSPPPRNPFSPDGSYVEIELPENPYRLLAVKLGGTPEALLLDYQGQILRVRKGQRLPDNSTVIAIKDTSVTIRRLNRTQELTIFRVEVEKWKPKR